jgi:uncharacterized protein
MKKVFIPILGVCLFIVVSGLFTKNYFKSFTESNTNRFEGPQKKIVYIGSLRLYVEVANTEELLRKGLSVRSIIKEDEGMIFIFDKKDIMPQIWMKGMEFPIDIIWIKDNKIAQITKNVAPPIKGTPDSKLKIYTPKMTVDYVLEVSGGYTDKNVVLEGANIDISRVFIK